MNHTLQYYIYFHTAITNCSSMFWRVLFWKGILTTARTKMPGTKKNLTKTKFKCLKEVHSEISRQPMNYKDNPTLKTQPTVY